MVNGSIIEQRLPEDVFRAPLSIFALEASIDDSLISYAQRVRNGDHLYCGKSLLLTPVGATKGKRLLTGGRC
ncbi:MAG: hypothetical protein GPOALKHO_001667 [Sodalis sp.]|uniref:hypothetical protein n=1 Tax=Sodalis sp. (in: enterobacteria) TaxID=1898979 RepID=UPI003873137C|nr:MAG: hypothetical protein GPOALKHO_001667 [Sodalis sp.]